MLLSRSAIISALAICLPLCQALAVNTTLVARDDDGLFIVELVDPDTGLTIPSDGQDAPDGARLVRRQDRSRHIGCTPSQIAAGWDEFQTSWCNRDVSPQAYSVRCDHGFFSVVEQGSCNDGAPGTGVPEICVDGVRSDQDGQRGSAYCVSTWSMTKLASAMYGGDRQSVRFTPRDKGLSADMFEVVLSGSPGVTSKFSAAHLKLEAQDSNRKTISAPGAVGDCDNCGSLGNRPWPKNTDSFLATVTIANKGDLAFVYGSIVAP